MMKKNLTSVKGNVFLSIKVLPLYCGIECVGEEVTQKRCFRVIHISKWFPSCLPTEDWIECPRMYREMAICGGKC